MHSATLVARYTYGGVSWVGVDGFDHASINTDALDVLQRRSSHTRIQTVTMSRSRVRNNPIEEEITRLGRCAAVELIDAIAG